METAAQSEVDLAAGHLTALITRHLPELVSSVTLVGSAADGDFRPGRSDLDFVAVLHRMPSEDDLEGIAIVHRLYAADPTMPLLDGIWITASDLADGPDNVQPGPSTRDGAFLVRADGNRNPVTWFTLREQGRTVLGTLDRAAIWHDRARLIEWTRRNVEDYWVPWQADAKTLISRRGLAMLGGSAVMWGVLGISRMHHTVATGEIASKSEAGADARQAFGPRWHRIVEESLRIRNGEHGGRYRSRLARRRDALDFMGAAIEAIRTFPSTDQKA